MKLLTKYIVGFLLFFSIISISLASEINIYSHRQPFLINPFLELFTEQTGIKTNVIYSKKGLAQRLQSEGENSPADVVLTVDIGRLYIYADLDLLAEIDSPKLISNIPVYKDLKTDDPFITAVKTEENKKLRKENCIFMDSGIATVSGVCALFLHLYYNFISRFFLYQIHR